MGSLGPLLLLAFAPAALTVLAPQRQFRTLPGLRGIVRDPAKVKLSRPDPRVFGCSLSLHLALLLGPPSPDVWRLPIVLVYGVFCRCAAPPWFTAAGHSHSSLLPKMVLHHCPLFCSPGMGTQVRRRGGRRTPRYRRAPSMRSK